MADKIIHQDKNMIVYENYDLYVEHNNHDNSCYLYVNKNKEIVGFNGCLDLHPHIINWINNHKKYFFGFELAEYRS